VGEKLGPSFRGMAGRLGEHKDGDEINRNEQKKFNINIFLHLLTLLSLSRHCQCYDVMKAHSSCSPDTMNMKPKLLTEFLIKMLCLWTNWGTMT
jgi:hypothetical protein